MAIITKRVPIEQIPKPWLEGLEDVEKRARCSGNIRSAFRRELSQDSSGEVQRITPINE